MHNQRGHCEMCITMNLNARYIRKKSRREGRSVQAGIIKWVTDKVNKVMQMIDTNTASFDNLIR